MPSQLCLPGIAAPPPETDRLFFALLPDSSAARKFMVLRARFGMRMTFSAG